MAKSKPEPLNYNCPIHGLDSGCKCPESGYRDKKRERCKENELRRLRKLVREIGPRQKEKSK